MMQAEEMESAAVRPYVVTGGRVGLANSDLPLETLVTAPHEALGPMSPEKRAILETASKKYISIAEISAHVRLPLGVVRVLVADLADDELVFLYSTVGSGASGSDYKHESPSRSVLESVLDGISVL